MFALVPFCQFFCLPDYEYFTSFFFSFYRLGPRQLLILFFRAYPQVLKPFLSSALNFPPYHLGFFPFNLG